MKKRFGDVPFPLTRADCAKLFLSVLFIGVIFLPVVRMFAHMDGKSILKVIQAPNFLTAVTNSLTSAVLGTLITVLLAFGIAMCIQRTNIRCKGIFGIIFVLPMLIPSISNGMGLVILLGNNGILTRALGLNGNIYGLWGIVTGSVLYAFPVAYLMLADVIHYEDGAPYEAANVLGIPTHRQFTAITLPYLRKPLISVIFTVFSLIITDYGVPLMVGGKYKTIATVMYQEVMGQLDLGKGSVYGCLLLIPAVIAFLIDFFNKDKAKSSFVTKPCNQSNRPVVKILSYLACILTCTMALLPVVSFALLAFAKNYPSDLTFTLANITRAIKLKADNYLINSILIALLTALAGVTISFFTAYLSARMKSRASRFLHLASMTSAAIPGMVLGLSYVLTFTNTPIYGTIFILVIVNIIHFIASPYLMMYNAMSKINENLENVAQTLGINRLFMIKDVFLPQCKSTLIEMFSYFFVNCMMTISAVSFLSTTANKPVALMINQFEAQMQLECAAVVSLMILLVNLVVKGTVHILKTRKGAKKCS